MDTDIRFSTKGSMLVVAAALTGLLACGGGGGGSSSPAAPPPPPPVTGFTVTGLVSDQASVTAHQDVNLVNPWGLAYGPSTYFWAANQGTRTSTVFDGTGTPPAPPIIVTVPGTVGPTGVVFNGTTGFSGDKFIFATLDGTVAAWASGTAAVVRADNSAAGASYTGLASGAVGTANYLYAANFKGGKIDVLDATYASTTLGGAAFVDPALPSGFSPFNIQNLGGKLYVAYAQPGATGRATAGAGLGYVTVFNTDGTLVGRLVSQGLLSAPWGLAMAPASFGAFAGALLVGNFGDGRITAYNATTGAAMGQLADTTGVPIAIDGLWAIMPGNDTKAGVSTAIYFTSGPAGETHGLFGSIGYSSTSTGGGGTGGNPY